MREPTREELYTAVWDKPLSYLAQAWGLKPKEVQAGCREQDIPMPENGHWSKLKFGKATPQVPLPPVPEIVEPVVDQSSRQVFEPPPIYPGETELSFRVPDRLIHPDKLVLAAEKGLAKDRYDEMQRSDDDQFPIRVMAANVNRALRIVDTLIKCWRRRGHRIEIKDRFAFVYTRGIKQRVHLYEVCKTLPKTSEHESRKLAPTGRLSFRMDWWAGREWKDGKSPLEDQILDILNHIELSARQLERERDRPDKVELPVIEQKDVQEPVPFSDDLEQFLADALRWKELKVLDEYLAAMFSAAEHTPEFLEWFSQIQQQRRTEEQQQLKNQIKNYL